MKNFHYLVLAFAICLGLAACGKEGGTLEVINLGPDSSKVTIRIDGVDVFNDVLSVGQSVKKSKDTDFAYYVTIEISADGTRIVNDGVIGGGDTLVFRRDRTNVSTQIK
jgi:hypothetical protein